MAKRKEGEILPTYILWTYSANSVGQHPVKLRVSHQGKRQYYPVYLPEKKKLFMSEADYKMITETPLQKLRNDNRILRTILDDSVTRANDAIETCTNRGKDPFTFLRFEREYLGEESGANFLKSFDAHLQTISAQGRAGTYRNYKTVYNQLKEFLNNRDIDPASLTPEKLADFEQWQRDEYKLNNTSIAIRMRCLRAIYNRISVNDDYLKLKYPFSRFDYDSGYKIPAPSGGQKGKTLTKEEIIAFIDGDAGECIVENPMYRAKQLFLFSFFGQGLNFADMARLQYSNIGKDTIEFERLKTIRTRTLPTKVSIPLTKELNNILIEQGNPDKNKNAFVFSLFDHRQKYTPKRIDDLTRQWIKSTNLWLKNYCEKNNLTVITTYASRHSFASLAKSHLSVAMISKMLGHARITTTQVYLGRFEDKENRSGLMKVFKGLKKKSA